MSFIRRYKEVLLNKPSDELGTSPLRLSVPLPDVGLSWRPDEDLNGGGDVEDKYYLDYVATGASMLTRKQGSATPRSIVWKVLQQSRMLEFECVDLKTHKSSPNLYRKIQLSSPIKFRSNCIAVSEDVREKKLVVDFITINGFLYTVSLSFDLFYEETVSTLTDANGTTWRSIKNPYSFDVRKPHMMYPVSSNILVVSLVDGTLLRLDRESPLGVVNTISFHDSSSGLSLTKLISWGHGDRVPGNPDMSVRAVISMNTSDDSLITLSINKSLKVWSLNRNALTSEHTMIQSGNQSRTDKQQLLLDANPSMLIAISSDITNKTPPAKYLLTYIPFEDGVFKIWKYDDEKQSLVDLGSDYEIASVPPDNSSVWLVCDLKLLSFEDGLEVWVTWKSDTSSSVNSLKIPFDRKYYKSNRNLLWSAASNGVESGPEFPKFSSSTSEDESEFYMNKIFGAGGYSLQTIVTALPIYGQHYANNDDDYEELRLILNGLKNRTSDYSELRDYVCRIVGAAVSVENSGVGIDDSYNDFKLYQRDLGLQWVRFNRLCEELEKQGQEVLSLSFDCENHMFYLVKASFVSVIGPVNDVELYYNNRSTPPSQVVVEAISVLSNKDRRAVERLLRLFDALHSFRDFLSHYVQNDLFVALEEDFTQPPSYLTTDRIEHMYRIHIEDQLSESAIGTLVTAMFEISELDELLAVVYDMFQSGKVLERVKRKSEKLTVYGAQTISKELYEFVYTGKLMVIDILIIILISSCQDDLVTDDTTNYAKFLKLLKSLCAILDLYKYTYLKSGEDDNDNEMVDVLQGVNNLSVTKDSRMADKKVIGLSFMESLLFDAKGEMANMDSSMKLWHHYNLSLNNLAAVEIAIELYNRGYYNQTSLFITSYFSSDFFSTLIKGCLFMKLGESRKGVTLLRKASVGMSSTSIFEQQLSLLVRLSDKFSPAMFGSGLCKYFYGVSIVLSSQQHHLQGLEFAKLAMLNFAPDDDEGEEISILTTLFECALKSKFYDDAYNSVVEMNLIGCDIKVQESAIDALVSAMTQSGHGRRMCQYPFIGLADMVTACLERKAQKAMLGSIMGEFDNKEEESREKIPYYKVLYSWSIERGDFRGGE